MKQVAVVAAASLGLGLFVSTAPLAATAATTALIVCGACVASVLAVRGSAGSSRPVAVSLEPDDSFRTGRLLFYAGMVLLGALVLRPRLGFTASDWLFLASALVVAARLAVTGNARSVGLPPLLPVGVLLFVVGGLVSSFATFDALASMSFVARFAYVTLIWFGVATVVLRETRHVERAVLFWCIAVGASGAAAGLQLATGVAVPGSEAAWGRLSGLAQHVNDLGGMTAIAAIPAFALATAPSLPRAPRVAALLSLAFALLGLVLSGSVGGLLALSAAGVCWVALRGVSIRSAFVATAAAVSLYALLHGTHPDEVASPFHRASIVASASEQERGTLWSRLATDEVALRRVVEQPVVGVGLDLRSSVTETGFQVHNILLKPFFEAGLFGGIGIALVLLAVGMAALTTVRAAASDDEHRLAASLLCAYVAAVTFAFGAPVLYQRYAWVPALLIISLAAVQARRGLGRSPVGS